MAVYTFCLHNGIYEMKVDGSISKIVFVKDVTVLYHRQQPFVFCAATLDSSSLSPESFIKY